MAGGGGFAGKTGLYAVGFNRREGVTGPLETACTLQASDYRGLNRNQTQTTVFVNLSAGAITGGSDQEAGGRELYGAVSSPLTPDS